MGNNAPVTSTSPRLPLRQSLLLGSLLFGLFFGAGNLIFPVTLGLAAGRATWPATLGFLVTAVGLPLLGVAASANSGTSSLHELAGRVAPWFGTLFTCALYLTVGPFFAIPRTATVSYEMALGARLDGSADRWALLAFSAVFFALVWAAARRPGRLLDVVGRYLTPVFLVLLAALLVTALVRLGHDVPPATGAYAQHPLAHGVLDGYNTMDALAALAFAIVVVEAARGLGVTGAGRIAGEVARAGIWAAIAMGVAYAALCLVGSRAAGLVARDANGAVALDAIARATVGGPGAVLAAAVMLVACLKTAIGLATACAEMFSRMFPRSLSEKGWATLFCLVSFGLANVGLARIIAAAVPVLVLLYPLVVTLVVVALLDRWTRRRPWAHRLPALGAGLASVLALVASLGGAAGRAAGHLGAVLPGFALGFGWVLPALVGLAVGLLLPVRALSKAVDHTR